MSSHCGLGWSDPGLQSVKITTLSLPRRLPRISTPRSPRHPCSRREERASPPPRPWSTPFPLLETRSLPPPLSRGLPIPAPERRPFRDDPRVLASSAQRNHYQLFKGSKNTGSRGAVGHPAGKCGGSDFFTSLLKERLEVCALRGGGGGRPI